MYCKINYISTFSCPCQSFFKAADLFLSAFLLHCFQFFPANCAFKAHCDLYQQHSNRSTVMSGSQNYQGILKYKIFMLLWLFTTVFTAIVGPYLYPTVTLVYCLFWTVCSMATLSQHLIGIFHYYQDFGRIYRKEQFLHCEDVKNSPYYHSIVIPNYKEQLVVLRETLDSLAKHQIARQSYIVILAMEAHQEQAIEKSNTLIQQYSKQFLLIDRSLHVHQPPEQKSKASNCNWVMHHATEIFEKAGAHKSDVCMTVIDADSLVPELYFLELNDRLLCEPQKFKNTIFCPSQINGRNYYDSPAFVRTYDDMHQQAHIGTMYSYSDLSIAFSNYSFAYQLGESFDFYDTNADAICDDFHFQEKGYFDVKLRSQSVPIPFNQLNISTGKGYCADIEAKIVQLFRHSNGIVSFSYTLLKIFQHGLSKKALIYLWISFGMVCQAHMPIILLAFVHSKLVYLYYPEAGVPEFFFESSYSMVFVSVICLLLNSTKDIVFEYVREKALQYYYEKDNYNKILYNWLLFNIYSIIHTSLVGSVAFFQAHFMVLSNERIYIRAEKVIEGNEDEEAKK